MDALLVAPALVLPLAMLTMAVRERRRDRRADHIDKLA